MNTKDRITGMEPHLQSIVENLVLVFLDLENVLEEVVKLFLGEDCF